MTTCANPTQAQAVATRGTGSVIGMFDLVLSWTERRRQRRALERLPDYLLADIGISRLDAAVEAEKPFWKG